MTKFTLELEEYGKKKKLGEVVFEKVKLQKGGLEKGKFYLLTVYKNKRK